MSSESNKQGGVDGPADGSPQDLVGDDGNSYYPLNTTEGMVILIVMIICMVLIPLIINRIMMYCDKSNNYRNKKEDNNKSSTTWKDYIRDGLYIEIKPRKPIQDIVNELIAEQEHETNIRDVNNIPIGPGCLVKYAQTTKM